MPCRTRRGGLDVEGLGIVYLEASATGLPVVAGDSGGAPDAVVEGETGWVVPGRSATAVAARVATLLADPAAARAAGEKGRAWVERDVALGRPGRPPRRPAAGVRAPSVRTRLTWLTHPTARTGRAGRSWVIPAAQA